MDRPDDRDRLDPADRPHAPNGVEPDSPAVTDSSPPPAAGRPTTPARPDWLTDLDMKWVEHHDAILLVRDVSSWVAVHLTTRVVSHGADPNDAVDSLHEAKALYDAQMRHLSSGPATPTDGPPA